jgi:hypothetical protein
MFFFFFKQKGSEADLHITALIVKDKNITDYICFLYLSYRGAKRVAFSLLQSLYRTKARMRRAQGLEK